MKRGVYKLATTIVLSLMMLSIALFPSCVGDSGVDDQTLASDNISITEFVVTTVDGTTHKAAIDNTARTVNIPGVLKGSLITKVSFESDIDGADFFPSLDSYIGNWSKEFTATIAATGYKADYKIQLADYEVGNNNILWISLDENNREQQVLFVGADMERSQNRFTDALNQQEIADWCFKDISWNVIRMSYDKAQELVEGTKYWAKYNSTLAAMKACRQANPKLEFWGTLKSDYNGYGSECNLPDWICNYGDGSKLLLDPYNDFAETTTAASGSNSYLYIDKYAHFLADYFEYFHKLGLTIKFTSTAKEWGGFVNAARTTELIPLLVADLRKRGVPPPMFNDNSEYSVAGGATTIKSLITNKMAPYYFGFCSHNYPGGEDRTYPFESIVSAAATANLASNNSSTVSCIYGDVEPDVTYIGTLHNGVKNGTLGAGSFNLADDFSVDYRAAGIAATNDVYDIDNPTASNSNRYYSPDYADYLDYLTGKPLTPDNHYYDATEKFCTNVDGINWLDLKTNPLNYGKYARTKSNCPAGFTNDESYDTYDYLLHASKNWIYEEGVTDNTNLNKVFWTFQSESGVGTMGATQGVDANSDMRTGMLDAVREKCEMFADGLHGELIFEIWACGAAGTRAVYFNYSEATRLSNYYALHSHGNFFNDGMYYYGASQINMPSQIYTMQFADFNVKDSDGNTIETKCNERVDKDGHYIRRVEQGKESMYLCVTNLGDSPVNDFQLTFGNNAEGYNGDVHLHIMDEQTVKVDGNLEGYHIYTKMTDGYLTFDLPAVSGVFIQIDLTRDEGSYNTGDGSTSDGDGLGLGDLETGEDAWR